MNNREWFALIEAQLDQKGKAPYYYSDEYLFEAMPYVTGDEREEIINALWERNLLLAYKTVRSYRVKESRFVEFRAFAEDTLRDAITTYEPRAKFSTYFNRVFLKRASTFLKTMNSPVAVPDSTLHPRSRTKASAKSRATAEMGQLATRQPLNIDDVEVVDESPSPEDVVIQRDLEQKTAAAVKTLSKLEQDIIKMVTNDQSFIAIGKKLHLTDKQVSRRYQAALTKIRVALGEEQE